MFGFSRVFFVFVAVVSVVLGDPLAILAVPAAAVSCFGGGSLLGDAGFSSSEY